VDEYHRQMYTFDGSHWLAQANDIFNRLDITWGFDNFGIAPFPSNFPIVMITSPVIVDVIDYFLKLSGPTENLPPGYSWLT
jgi:hypothetical protein